MQNWTLAKLPCHTGIIKEFWANPDTQIVMFRLHTMDVNFSLSLSVFPRISFFTLVAISWCSCFFKPSLHIHCPWICREGHLIFINRIWMTQNKAIDCWYLRFEHPHHPQHCADCFKTRNTTWRTKTFHKKRKNKETSQKYLKAHLLIFDLLRPSAREPAYPSVRIDLKTNV